MTLAALHMRKFCNFVLWALGQLSFLDVVFKSGLVRLRWRTCYDGPYGVLLVQSCRIGNFLAHVQRFLAHIIRRRTERNWSHIYIGPLECAPIANAMVQDLLPHFLAAMMILNWLLRPFCIVAGAVSASYFCHAQMNCLLAFFGL